ncbi:basic amino acid ABC transporter substrate-binding protein [Calothrix sp. HK-06]|nr:basic amino acid ABC transporter substrate-binding protein [Calothrix sp. HK-06]
MINRKWCQLFLGIIVSVMIIACSINFNTTDISTFKVATDPTFLPFSYQTANGELEGFDIDIINAVSQAAGLKLELESITFDGMIAALVVNRVDAAINGITITRERLQTVSFSRPYMKAGLAIAVRENNQDIKDLNTLAGKIIGVQIGTTGANYAKTISNAEIRNYNTGYEFFQELLNGNVDAVICDGFATLYAIKTGNLSRVKVVSDLLTQEYYGIAMPKDSLHLDSINKAIATIFANGTYKQIYQKWFNTEPPKLPESIPSLS